MSEILEVRCSSLPLALACPASQVRDGPLIETAGDEAALGTAVHAWLARRVLGQQPTAVGDHEGLGLLTHLAGRCWEALAPWFPAPQVEVEMRAMFGDITLTGHADVLSVVVAADGQTEVRISDWKSGWGDEDHEPQLRGYCWLAMLRHPTAFRARACAVRIRDQSADWYAWTHEELFDWWRAAAERLVVLTAKGREVYHPGPWQCGRCPRGPTCPARTALIRNVADTLEAAPSLDLLSGPDAGRVAMQYLEGAKFLESLCEVVRGLVRSEVALRGGRLPTGDGRELVITQQERQSIDPGRGLGIVSALAGPRLPECVTIAKGRLERVVMDGAARGAKKAALEEMYERLQDAGALHTTFVEKLEVKRGTAEQGRIGGTDGGATLGDGRGKAPGAGDCGNADGADAGGGSGVDEPH